MERDFGRRDAIVRLPGVEHGKPVVVLGREDDIAHAGGLGRRRPSRRVEFHRIEGAGQGLVGLLVGAVVVHGAPAPRLVFGAESPGLDDAPLAVGPPVYHEAELPVLPFGETGQDEGVGFALGFGGLGGRGDRKRGQGQPGDELP